MPENMRCSAVQVDLIANSLPHPVEFALGSAVIASSGRGAMQEVASKKVGEASVSYSTSSSVASSVSTGFAELKETVYGLQLLGMLRLYGYAMYVP